MSRDLKSTEKKPQNVTVSSEAMGSQYSHGAIINISDFDITMEFVYIGPTSKAASIVSRVTMPMIVAEQFIASLNNALAQKKEAKNV